MKICAIICEYNPFHNGHLYHLGAAKQTTGADFVVCIMSGNFVQRGEAAAMGKYARARHAVLAGADAVIHILRRIFRARSRQTVGRYSRSRSPLFRRGKRE